MNYVCIFFSFNDSNNGFSVCIFLHVLVSTMILIMVSIPSGVTLQLPILSEMAQSVHSLTWQLSFYSHVLLHCLSYPSNHLKIIKLIILYNNYVHMAQFAAVF